MSSKKWQVIEKNGFINQIGIGIISNNSIDPIGCAYGNDACANANARLMAASPDLLIALESMLCLVGEFAMILDEDVVDKARIAIAKARGEK